MKIYNHIQNKYQAHECQLAVLIDPDLSNVSNLKKTIQYAEDAGVDLFFVGGSLVMNDYLDNSIKAIKNNSTIPVILFPGSPLQMSPEADAILFLSLISGRNAELLIGSHVLAAPYLRMSGLEAISTGYILVDGGIVTAVSYISNTQPIPSHKPEIAVSTALAGQYLGMKCIYMDAGSGAKNPIPVEMIQAVRANINIPLIIGGGIRDIKQVKAVKDAGANIIVVGNAVEANPTLIKEMKDAIQ